MSQTTEPVPDNWRAPWAAAAPGGPFDADAPTASAPLGPEATPYGPAASGGHTRPIPGPIPGEHHTQPLPPFPPPAPMGAGAPGGPGSGGVSGAPGRREPRRPGWGGVVAVGAGAAVLSSLLTAGVMSVTGQASDSSTGTTTAASSSSVSQPPALVESSSSLPNWGTVAAAVEPSVVSVRVESGTTGGEGSGVILDTQGRILTNNHVVADASGGGTITVVLSDGRGYPATVVGTDPSTDLAVIKMNTTPSGLKPATLGDSGAVRIGDPVMAIGNPLGLSDTVTTGIVSALNRPVRATTQGQQTSSSGEGAVTNAIQTDAAINPGNSGGALVDAGGRVIGITSSIAALNTSFGGQSGSIGLGFAIPINEGKAVSDELIKNGSVQHAYLGVTLRDDAVTVDGAQRQAAVIRSVSAGTPAAQSGLEANDAVIAINGQPIDSSDSLVGTVRALKPGVKVTLTIVRNGATKDVALTLAQRPAGNG